MNPSDDRCCSRRQWIRTTAAAAGSLAMPSIIPSSALGRPESVAASERITVGFIGIGAMGSGHLAGLLNMEDVQVLAVCDVDRGRRDTAKRRVETSYGQQRQSPNYRGCASYNDLRELLDRSDIDAVVIATGDRWHVPAGVLAARSGKDIYCEKPMSLTIHEARAMTDAVRRYGRVFQTGLQQRSMPEFRWACRAVQEGRLGQLRMVYINHPGTNQNVSLPPEPIPEGLDWDLWLGPAPWRPFNGRLHHVGRPRHVIPWNFCRDFGGGNLTANAVHALDVVQWALNRDGSGPVQITPPETGNVPSLTYRYADGVRVQVTPKLDPQQHHVPPGWDVNTPIQSFGAVFVGEHGWIHVGRRGYLQSYPQRIVGTVRFPRTHPVAYHHRDWIDCIRARRRPACDVAIGGGSTIMSHLGCIAHWTGRSLTWDPASETFDGDEEANQWRSRTMREPWYV
jgi:predicted dehydrogenase